VKTGGKGKNKAETRIRRINHRKQSTIEQRGKRAKRGEVFVGEAGKQ